MSIDILELVKSQVSPELVDKAAALLGESPEAVQSGLLGSSGALLSGLAGKLSDAGSASQIFNSLGSGNILDSLGQQLAGGNETVKFLSGGLDKAKGLLGDNTDSIMSALGSASGLRPESASSLVGMAAPMVTGVLAKQKAAGMSLDSMSSMLSSQAASFSGLLPAGMELPAIPGLDLGTSAGITGAVGSMADKGADLVGEAWDKTTIVADSAIDSIGDAANAAKDAASAAVGKVGDLASDAFEGVGDLGEAAAGTVGDAADAAMDAAGAAADKVGDLASGALEGAGDLASGALDTVTGAAGSGGSLLSSKGFWVAAVAAFIAALFTARGCSPDDVTDMGSKALTSGTEMVKDAGDAVKDGADAAMDKSGELAVDAVDAAGDMANKAADAAGNAVDSTVNMADKAIDAAGDLADSAGDAAKAGMDAAGDMATDTGKAAGDMLDAGADKLAAMGQKIGDKFRFALPGGANVDVPEGSFEAGLLKSFAEGNAEYGNAYVLDRIYFASGSYELTAESSDQLKTMASILKAYPELTANLRGHTDSSGSADKNLALSLNRARAVKTFLSEQGIAAERVTTVGKGSAEALADNGTPQGRAKNRRIDISFTK